MNEDSSEMTSVYSDLLQTSQSSGVLLGKPTRKYAQGFGYDETHVLQLATITAPRGARELGGVATL